MGERKFSTMLRGLREERGLSYEDAAKRYCCTVPLIRKTEAGYVSHSNPRLATIARYGYALGLSKEELIALTIAALEDTLAAEGYEF